MTAGAAPAGRWARIVALGSTASTHLSCGLVGPCPGADVENGARVAERGVNAGRDPRIGPPVFGVRATVAVVVDGWHAPYATELAASKL